MRDKFHAQVAEALRRRDAQQKNIERINVFE